jgi:type IV pilus assembly protein PilB
MSAGRITEEDVGRALAYQRDHGGYFGEALLACGLVSEGELEWGLASQADLPYVFPDAESVDYGAASMVSPEWALAHLTLPILRTDEKLTVIVESPIKTKAVDELRSRTDLEIELALASPSRIRDLIREVYARASAADESGYHAPIGLDDAWDSVLNAAASRFGISVRGQRASVWWDEEGTVQRRPLAGNWVADLEQSLRPGPSEAAGRSTRAHWDAGLNRRGMVTRVEVRLLRDESGQEYLFHPRREVSGLQERFPLPAEGILSEIRLLARTGKARFIVTTVPASLGHEILPHLPELLLDPTWRSIYISATDRPAAAEAFSHRLSEDPAAWVTELETLCAFQFDVVTVDLVDGGDDSAWTASALDVGSVAFLLWSSEQDVGPAYAAGIRWHLRISQGEGGALDWTLEPLH